MRLIWLLAALLAIPAAQAGTADAPDITDPAGDVASPVGPGVSPCDPGIDVLAFWAEWTDAGVLVHYRFSDLSVVEQFGPVFDTAGRCFYSYVDFEAVFAGKPFSDSIYVDYVGSPAFATGWRFYFHGSGDDLQGSVDVAASQIAVLLPFDVIGRPMMGDGIGKFSVQAVTAPVDVGLESDLAPDSGQPCDCWVAYPADAASGPTDPASSSSSSSSMTSSGTTSSTSTSRSTSSSVPKGAAAGASTTSTATSQTSESDKGSPSLGLAALLAALAAVAALQSSKKR